ncbi:hypothetical protein F7R21_24205, partial [Burkholderia latens]
MGRKEGRNYTRKSLVPDRSIGTRRAPRRCSVAGRAAGARLHDGRPLCRWRAAPGTAAAHARPAV